MSTLTSAPVDWTDDDEHRAACHRPRAWWSRMLRGRETDARWVRPALLTLLGLTALLYLTDLSASGYANSFYAAAVQAGTKSWKAMLFGSFDASNFITVDKPPASLWVMEISGRIFGFSSWSMLVPQALEGVAAVGVVYATVRRRFSPAAALIAGACLALTPVTVMMFRFNNPDALLVLLMAIAAYAVLRGLESARDRSGTRWLVLAGVALGFAFLAKSLQALLVVPALGAVWLLAADVRWRRKLFQLAAGLLAMVASAGWWLLTVSLWPASSRPYIGGSQDNSVWNLIFGYNGFGRITGNETGSVGGQRGPGGTSMWGATGITRLLSSDFGAEISWLLPAALVLAVALLVLWRRRPRTDLGRAHVVLWLGWLLVTGLTFSFMKGIIHPYYAVALAPPIAALVGIGTTALWQRRESMAARATLAGVAVLTAAWAFVLLDRSPAWFPWLRWAVLVLALAAAAAILAAHGLRRFGLAAAVSAVVMGLVAPAAYAVDTAHMPHTGAIPSAGPQITNADFLSGSGSGGPGGFGGPGTFRSFRGPAGFRMHGFRGFPGMPGGGTAGAGGFPGGTTPPAGALPSLPSLPGGLTRRFGAPGGGAAGGLLNAGTVSSGLAKRLARNASSYRWVAAAISAESAAGFQLASGEPVMAIGGFNGTDPAPTLAQFKAYVAAGDIHYFIAGGAGRGGLGGGPMGGSSQTPASAIQTWVAAHFTAETVDGVTLYDLSSAS